MLPNLMCKQGASGAKASDVLNAYCGTAGFNAV